MDSYSFAIINVLISHVIELSDYLVAWITAIRKLKPMNFYILTLESFYII